MLVRHIHAQPFVSTSRPDILSSVCNNGIVTSREDQKKSDPVNMRLFLNAQEIINISKVRLCNKAEFATREAWITAIQELKKIEPLLASACVPSCIYRGMCPEIQACGFNRTHKYRNCYNNYINNLTEFQNDSKRTD